MEAFLGFLPPARLHPLRQVLGSMGEANPEVLLVKQIAQFLPYLPDGALFPTLVFHCGKFGCLGAVWLAG